ncbi:MAG TPA: hypothetical protein VGX25_00865 [Actinophytocola sp.]|uniref:DUF6817 domain-containing protein n=1 Tax=Actinophytocola sp. TaxID=1872138 RepID=UPI002DDD4B58|nr:hypothetical protein [Actinophytocola sp.]HEV2777927.1 hypothetical protein [Actinophytocola sp.]
MTDVEEFLVARGAEEMPHPGGTLLAHLCRTRDMLASWGARPALCLAGLAHAAYGTDGFPQGLVEVAARPTLVEVIGPEAEEIVYRYGSCDRGFSYPRLHNGGPMRDRFTGAEISPDGRQVRDFVELTVASELDVLTHNDDLRAEHGAGLRGLFTAWRPYASGPAIAAVTEFFG